MMLVIKRTDFALAVKEAAERRKEAEKEFNENGQICLKCHEELGDLESDLCFMHCKKCNAKTEDILCRLRKSKGFTEIRVGSK